MGGRWAAGGRPVGSRWVAGGRRWARGGMGAAMRKRALGRTLGWAVSADLPQYDGSQCDVNSGSSIRTYRPAVLLYFFAS